MKNDSEGSGRANVERWFFVGIMLLLLPHLNGTAQIDERNLPTLPGAALLMGYPPESLWVTTPGRILRLPGEGETGDEGAIYPSISKDGKLVAYAQLKFNGAPRRVSIATYALLGGDIREYGEGVYYGSIALSPDASKLAIIPSEEKGLTNVSIIHLKSAERSLGPQVPTGARAILTWSPDSTRLAYDFYPFDFHRTGSSSFDFSRQIRVWDSVTGRSWKIGDGKGPAWSPDGQWIAYLSSSSVSCMIVHPDGSGMRVLIGSSHSHGQDRNFLGPPVWSPDSSQILLNETADEDAHINVYLLNVSTLKLTMLFKKRIWVFGWAQLPNPDSR